MMSGTSLFPLRKAAHGKTGATKSWSDLPKSWESLLLFFTNCPENSSFNCLGMNYTLVWYCCFSCGSTCSIIASCTKHKMLVLAVQKCFFIDLQDSISGSLKLRDLKEILFAHSTSTRLAYLLHCWSHYRQRFQLTEVRRFSSYPKQLCSHRFKIPATSIKLPLSHMKPMF